MSQKKSLIIFFIPPEKVINGGIMATYAHCRESRGFHTIHHSDVILCTYPGSASYKHNDLFDNDEYIYNFDEVRDKWKRLDKLMVHIPETAVRPIGKIFAEAPVLTYLQKINKVHINVMNQNIDLMRDVREFAELFTFTPYVTQTTAHRKYTTQQLSDDYQTPVHHLSVCTDRSQFNGVPYSQKEDLIVYSPDFHPAKEKVLEILKRNAKFKLVEIKNLPYKEFENLTRKAKFSLTFGEGFDGYFIRGFFLGSVGIAVYNERFFPDKNYLEDLSVFENYDALAANLVKVLGKLDNEKVYDAYVAHMQSKFEKLYSRDQYLENMKNFYKGSYTLYPQPFSVHKIITSLIQHRNNELHNREIFVKELAGKLKEEQGKTSELYKKLDSIQHSWYWRVLHKLKNSR